MSTINVLDTVWFEKYRPQTLEDMVLPKRLKTIFNEYIKIKNIPNILMISPSPGTGKTTIAKILAKELDASLLMVNGRMRGGIETIRNKIENFAINKSYNNKQKIVLIDEADGLSPEAQGALQGFIEEFVEHVRFIFTANNEHVFNNPIKSRFQTIYFDVPEEEYKDLVLEFTEKCFNMLDNENVEYDDKIVFKIVKENFPDYRMVVQTLNSLFFSYGKITKNNVSSSKTIKKIISAINNKSLKEIREIIKNEANINYNNIYSKLFEHIDLFDYNINTVAFILADWDYKNKFVADKVLNFVGMCADLFEYEQ